ncbi:MAG: L,D-transpeptidase family protein [Prosthecobacter sp.]|uniref:L,D-transpeptidase family protein n=1 Tax=Prosthecobacter sp. TaxID=1965333 RepID=UPI003BB11EE7
MHRFLVMLLMLASCARMTVPVKLPAEITAVLPSNCRQVLYVTAADQQTTAAELRMLERTPTNDWQAAGPAIPSRIGRNGMAWGHGEFALASPSGWRIKKEGDGCAPAGVFRITQAFGDGQQPGWIKLPYLQCTKHHWGIDDVRSKHYNQIVDDRTVACDWTGPETMVPSIGCYKLGAVIAHNPRNTPGLGSCIFMHIWQGENVPTAGCTAMSEANLRKVLAWLEPHANPCLVQLVQQP